MADFSSRTGVAFVAGGTGGIGAAVVRMLAERGSDVAFTYRTSHAGAHALAAEVKAYGRQVLALRLDLGDEQATAEAVAEASDAFGACTRSCTRRAHTCQWCTSAK